MIRKRKKRVSNADGYFSSLFDTAVHAAIVARNPGTFGGIGCNGTAVCFVSPHTADGRSDWQLFGALDTGSLLVVKGQKLERCVGVRIGPAADDCFEVLGPAHRGKLSDLSHTNALVLTIIDGTPRILAVSGSRLRELHYFHR